MSSIDDVEIINYVKTYFDFLINTGFVIHPVEHISPMDGWRLLLDSKSIQIQLFSDRGEFFLAINPKHENFWISLSTMVYYLTNEKVLLDDFRGDFYKDREKQYQRLAEILRKYWNEIQEMCNSKLPLQKDEFRNLGKKVSNLKLARFMKH